MQGSPWSQPRVMRLLCSAHERKLQATCWARAEGQCVYCDCRLYEGADRLCVAWQAAAGRSALQAPQELLQLLQQGAGAQAAPRPPIQPEGQEGAGPHSFTCGVRPAAKRPSAVHLGAWCQRCRVLAPAFHWRPLTHFAHPACCTCMCGGEMTPCWLHGRQSRGTCANP